MNRNFSLCCFGLLLALSSIVPGHAFAQEAGAGCGLNAYVAWTETKGNKIINHCKCSAGHERYLGACIKAVCAQAFNRLKTAQEGGRHALATLGQEAAAHPARKILAWLDLKGGPTTRALLYVEALRGAESGLDELAAYHANRPADDDAAIRQAISTINSFRGHVKETIQTLQQNDCSRD